MNDELFETLLDDYLPEEKKNGATVEGVIVRKEKEFSYLDINDKLEGRILTNEIENYNIGDTIEVKVLRHDNENIIVSMFLLEKAREFDKMEIKSVVTGKIIKKVKGGYILKVNKNEAFLPFSLSGFSKNYNPIGEEVSVLIKEKNRNNVMVSRIDILKNEENEFFNQIQINDVLEGKITEILDFGLVVQLPKMTGLIHVSEIFWLPVSSSLNEYFTIGQNVSVKVIDKDDVKHKLKLSIKQLSEDPWTKFTDSYAVGDRVDVIVKEILDFGVVVDKDGYNGFIHISELSWNNNHQFLKNLKIGEILNAKIIEINADKKSIKLSIKQITTDPWITLQESYKIGDILEKEVKEILDFGLIVTLDGNEEGFIHISEISRNRNLNLEEKYKIGDKVKFKIIGFNNAKRRLSLSIKALGENLWSNLDEFYRVGEILNGTIVNIEDFGIFLELENTLDVFIHKNEYAWLKEDIIDFNLGQILEFKLINLDLENRKMSGSLKQLTVSPIEEEEKELADLMEIYGVKDK